MYAHNSQILNITENEERENKAVKRFVSTDGNERMRSVDNGLSDKVILETEEEKEKNIDSTMTFQKKIPFFASAFHANGPVA